MTKTVDLYRENHRRVLVGPGEVQSSTAVGEYLVLMASWAIGSASSRSLGKRSGMAGCIHHPQCLAGRRYELAWLGNVVDTRHGDLPS
jgi:hypothetical protein